MPAFSDLTVPEAARRIKRLLAAGTARGAIRAAGIDRTIAARRKSAVSFLIFPVFSLQQPCIRELHFKVCLRLFAAEKRHP
jgi:hypothetical protein